MKRLTLVLMMLFIIPIVASGQTVDLLKQYEIPTYEYHSLILSSPDLFDLRTVSFPDTDTKTTNIRAGIMLEEYQVKQSPRATSMFRGYAQFDYRSTKTETGGNTVSKNDRTMLDLMVTGNSNRYFDDDRGLFFHVGLSLVHSWNFTDEIRSTVIFAPVGLGYGRIIGVRNVVQAHIISEELGAGLTDDQKLSLAEVIDRYQNGHFDAEFRDDGEIEYYQAIAEITGKPGDAMKVRQITESRLYKTSERRTGWEVKAGIFSTYVMVAVGSNSASDYQADLFGSLEFALPMDMNKQVLLSAYYTKPLDDDAAGNPILNFAGQFSIDHSFTWATTLRTDWSQVMPDVGDSYSNLSFSLGTEYVLLNSVSMDASITYNTQQFQGFPMLHGVVLPIETKQPEQNTTLFHLGFSYYLK